MCAENCHGQCEDDIVYSSLLDNSTMVLRDTPAVNGTSITSDQIQRPSSVTFSSGESTSTVPETAANGMQQDHITQPVLKLSACLEHLDTMHIYPFELLEI